MDREPVNYPAISAAAELALSAHKDISETTAQEVLEAVEVAVESNSDLMFREDYDEFVGVLDGNGYDEQVTKLDRIRGRLEAEQHSTSSAEAVANAVISEENTND